MLRLENARRWDTNSVKGSVKGCAFGTLLALVYTLWALVYTTIDVCGVSHVVMGMTADVRFDGAETEQHETFPV